MSACAISPAQSINMTSSLTSTHRFFRCFYGRDLAFSPKPVKFKAFKPEKVMVVGVEREKTSHYKPRGLRWSGVKATDKKALSWGLSMLRSTTTSDLTHTPLGVAPLLFYFNLSNVVSGGHFPCYFLLASHRRSCAIAFKAGD